MNRKVKMCSAVLFLLLFSACGEFVANVTPTPEPTPTVTPAETPTPTPEPSFLTYEEFFSQEMDYGSMFDGIERDYGIFRYLQADDPAIAEVQAKISDDTLGLVSRTLTYIVDDCFSVFWAGNEEGAYLYRYYFPSETLDLIYTVPKEEFEENYFYTPQTEDCVKFLLELFGLECQVGERVCLICGVNARGNQFYEWRTANPKFLKQYDEIVAHKEDYPQIPWNTLVDYEKAFYVEREISRVEVVKFCVAHCINTVTNEYRNKPSGAFSGDMYEIQW